MPEYINYNENINYNADIPYNGQEATQEGGHGFFQFHIPLLEDEDDIILMAYMMYYE